MRYIFAIVNVGVDVVTCIVQFNHYVLTFMNFTQGLSGVTVE